MWLYTVPDKQEKTRYERLINDGAVITPPEMQCSYLFDYLLRMGAVSTGVSGTTALSWVELNAWVQVTGIQLSLWELEVIRSASEAYATQLELSKKPDAPMPERIIEQDPRKLAKRIKSILR